MKSYIIERDSGNPNRIHCWEVIGGVTEYMKVVNEFEVENLLRDASLGKIRLQDKR